MIFPFYSLQHDLDLAPYFDYDHVGCFQDFLLLCNVSGDPHLSVVWNLWHGHLATGLEHDYYYLCHVRKHDSAQRAYVTMSEGPPMIPLRCSLQYDHGLAYFDFIERQDKDDIK